MIDITALEKKVWFNGIDWNSEKTHIFRINVEESYSSIKDSYEEILSERELNKAHRFYHISDRKSYLVRKYYLRMILSKLLSVTPDMLVFKQTGNKKPTVTGLEFNSSHSGIYAVIAVSPSSIGIDIEKVNDSFDFKSIVDCCYDEEEQRFVNSGNASSNFYYLWTRKEALCKASAEGLTDALRLVNCLPDQVIRTQVRYRLMTSFLEQDYILTIAAKESSAEFKYWEICG
jgi:4'-phosphopantetheinyl transferase